MTVSALPSAITWLYLLVSTGVLYLIYSWRQRIKYKNFPPFPITPLPIVGHLLAMEKNPRHQILRWSEKVGDIFTLNLAGNHVVFVHGFKRIKEIYVKNGHKCSDRPVLFHDTATDTVNLGVGTSSGCQWKEERATAYTILKSLGMGKGRRATNVEDEMSHFLEELAKTGGRATDVHDVIMPAVCNTVISMLFGERLHYQNPDFKRLVETIAAIIKMAAKTQLLQVCPKLVWLPGDFFQGKALAQRIVSSFNWVYETFVRGKDTNDFNGGHEPTNDFVLAYFRERLRKEKAGTTTLLHTKSLLKTLSDLLVAGTESTTTTLLWFTLYMLHFPDTQEKAFREIEKHVGTERMPNTDDQDELVYVHAVIMETQRLASITPFPIMHRCSGDIQIAGYTLPKGTDVSINLDSVFYDEEIWGPDVRGFRPERFIDQNGQLMKKEEFIPYSIGRRQCLAESYAKTQLFMFVSGMIQRFEFKPENPGELPPRTDVSGLASPPTAFKVRCVDRRKKD